MPDKQKKDNRRLDLVEKCILEGRRFREEETAIPNPFGDGEIAKPWYYYDRLVRGFQWDYMTSMASWVSRPVKNLIHMAVESYTTMLTDNNPGFVLVPREEADEEVAEIVQAAAEYWWKDERCQEKVAMAVKSSRIYGLGWLHVRYDKDAKKTKLEMVPAENVYVDPDTTVDNYDPTWVLYETRMQVGELMARYDIDWKLFDPKWVPGMETQRPDYRRYHDNLNPALSCAVYQLWYKDPKRILWEDEEGDKLVQKSKRAHPGGVVITVAGGLVLDEKENPYHHEQIPFTPVHCYPLPGKFYGMGDVQNLLNIQVMRNRMSQYIFDQTCKAGGGYILVGQGSGLDVNDVKNALIQILPVRDASTNSFRVERPPMPQRYVFEYIALLDKDGDDAVGMHDISRGTFVPGNKTAQEVATLAESDRTRVRMASRWLTWALERVGNQVLSCWEQYGDQKKMLMLAGKETTPVAGEAGETEEQMEPRFVEFDPKKMLERSVKRGLKFDLKVEDTSTLPATQQQKNNQIGMLLQWGVLMPEDVLKYKLVDIPHADEILNDRLARQQAETEAMAQAQMGAMPPAPMEMPVGTGGAGPLPPEAMGAMPQPMGGPAMLQGLSPEQQMALAEQVAAETGLSPEQVLQQMYAMMGGE